MVDFPIRVVVDPSGAVSGARRARGALQGVDDTANKLRQTLRRVFGAAALGLAARRLVSTLASFEQTLSTVRAVSGATEQQFRQLRRAAQDLGATTRFSASQAGEGLLFLSRAGFDVQESLSAIRPTLNLAQAGALDLGSAADIASNVLQGFRLEADETSRVVDVLALTANSSNTDVRQLGEAMKFVAPVAAAAGVEIEDAAAAVGQLGNAGIQASLAGTGLRAAILKLSAPAEGARRALRDLGLTAEEVDPATVGLGEAFRRLGEAGLDTTSAVEIFDRRTATAALALAAAGSATNEMRQRLDEAGGTAERVAGIMDDNLNGALLRVRSALEAVTISFGDFAATSILRDFFERLAESLRFVARNIEDFVQFAIGALLIPAFVRTTRAVQALTVALARNPFGLFITAASLAVGALTAFGSEIQIAEDSAATLNDVFVAFGETVVDNISEGISIISDFVTNAIDVAVSATQEFLSVLALISPILRDNFTEAKDSIGEARDEIVSATTTFEGFFALITRGFNLLQGVFSGLFAAIFNLFSNLPRVVGDVIIQTINFVIDRINDQIRLVFRLLNEVRAQAQRILPGLAGRAGENLVAPQVDRIRNRFAGNAAAVGEAFKVGFNREQDDGFIAEVIGRAEGRARERANEIGRDVASEFFEGFKASEARITGANVEQFADVFNRAFSTATPLPPGLDQLQPGGAGGSPGGGGRADEIEKVREALSDLNLELENERELLSLSEQERAIRLARLDAEQALTNARIDITRNDVQEELRRVEASARTNEQLRIRNDLLEQIRTPEEERAQLLAQINDLYAAGIINQMEFNRLQAELPALLDESNSQFDDFLSRLERAEESAFKLGSAIGDALVSSVDRASNAIADFVVGGLQDFNSFREAIADILLDLAKQIIATIVKALILRAITAALSPAAAAAPAVGSIAGGALGAGAGGLLPGGLGGGIAGLGFQGRVSGGPVSASRGYLVNEAGPELFVRSGHPLSASVSANRARRFMPGARQGGGVVIPGDGQPTLFRPPSAGTIVPAAQTAALLNGAGSQRQNISVQPPQVTVRVQNTIVRDEREVQRQLQDDPEAQETVLNIVRMNPESQRR